MQQSVKFLLLTPSAAIVSAIPIINWPFSWIATYFHEISHGMMALLTGGSVHRIHMYLFGGGVCEVLGGVGFLVSFSGYAGAVLWGMTIYLMAESLKAQSASLIAKGLAALVFLSLLLWARDIITILILAAIGTMFIMVATLRTQHFVRWFTQFIGIYVLLKSITSPLALIDGRHYGDGAQLTNMTLVPEILWVLIWVAIGCAGLLYLWHTQLSNPKKL